MHNPSAPPSHLIGIREEPGGHEISTSFQQLGSFSEVPPPGRAAAAGTSQQQQQVPPTRVLSDLRPNEATNGRDSKTSSGSGSSRGGSSTARLGQDDLPWIQRIEFQFDGMADSFPLLKASIFFDGHAATESSACRTMMKGWLMDSMLPRFRGWVQHTINNGMAGRGVTFNPTPSTVELLWPGREDMVLRADEVQFRVEVLDETEGLQVEQKTSQASRCTETTAHAEDADQEGEPDESVSVWVTMRGFHQCQSHEKKRSSRTAQSPGQARALAAIQEHDRRMFQGGYAAGRTQAPTLAALQEHDRRMFQGGSAKNGFAGRAKLPVCNLDHK
ncbi:unnamed protein product [Polarella glacialis]|uniref:Uncharacterized protein n=1 Tax=Polarella glacialis TaxID=89957 RepID=A0A813KMR0_POLGL|nr:unnamed protein product [Polarella glacialis]